jgi:ketosteroid isomerase-like protein
MTGRDQSDDVRAIKALISEQFRSGLQWTPTKPADWTTFANGFLPDASLFPAARPARRQSVDAFIARMDGLARDKLRSFEETMLGMEVLVFGSVAVVLGASEMVENGTEVNRDVTGFLLIKDDGKWRIAAQAWDHEAKAMPIPEHLRHA